MTQRGSRLHGILLVAGTSIGGGMLALPVLTSQVGFIPSLFIYFFCWFFMACTGLLFLEVSLWMKKDANIITMAEQTLGIWGKIAAWGLYLFLFYCLTLAYIVGAGSLIVDLFSHFMPLKEWQGELIFLLVFAPLICLGNWIIGRLNLFLMFGLIGSYLVFVVIGSPHVSTNLLLKVNLSHICLALPITFTAFAYQGIIPTLITYMHRNVFHVRQAILIGSFLPFIAYSIWQWLILGIVPAEGAGSLSEALKNGQTAIQPLKNILNVPEIYIIGQFFAFFALITSFFGVTLGLFDFLADGLNLRKNLSGKFYLCLLIFLPPFLFSLTHPHIFLIALDYAGGFGCALLLGLLPILMVWSGRYKMGRQAEYQVSGGKWLLSCLIAFVLFELICEFISKIYV